MTESELLAAAHEFVSRMDVILEFWISGTFAVLVAFFFVGNRATERLKWLSVSLYFIFSCSMVFRYFQLGTIYTTIRVDLEKLGSNYVVPVGGNIVAAALTIFLLIAGTFITVYFIFRADKIVQSDSADDT